MEVGRRPRELLLERGVLADIAAMMHELPDESVLVSALAEITGQPCETRR
jgi:hypothetical protein